MKQQISFIPCVPLGYTDPSEPWGIGVSPVASASAGSAARGVSPYNGIDQLDLVSELLRQVDPFEFAQGWFRADLYGMTKQRCVELCPKPILRLSWRLA